MSESEVTDAIADTDYFIVNSVSLPLFEAVGFPTALASVSGVILAAIPSQLVKIGQQERERKLLLRQLLLEEKGLSLRRKQRWQFPPFGSDWIKVYASKAASSAALFGIYEQSQIPISRWIQGTLAGGVDGK